MRRVRRAILAVGFVVAAMAISASAQTTRTDLLVAGRALGFIDNLKSGEVRVGIVYEPGTAQSAQQAAEFKGAMTGGLRVGSLVLEPVMLPVGKLGGASVDVFFLTEGVGAAAANVGRASHARKIPCITFDLAQVRNGACAMGVQSQPKIEVLVNRAAADASGMELAAVFRMMITEVSSNGR